MHDYNIPEIDDYCSKLKKEYSPWDVQKSKLNKNKHFISPPLLLTLTFKEKEAPRFIEILGEEVKIKA